MLRPDDIGKTSGPQGRGGLSAADEDDLDSLIGKPFGVYQCQMLIGTGAMGRVYLAKHLDLHRSCALKILPARLAQSDPAYLDRFMTEGRSVAGLVHPNVVMVHAIGEHQGHFFLEMEFVAGQTLRQMIDDEGAQSPVRATSLTARVAEGLAEAHARKILHRDLKLENILLTHLGVPKIVDFGLARQLTIPTRESDCVGTPHYMAPELYQGQAASPASDVFALGVCYYQLLTGVFPWDAPTIRELAQKICHEPYPSPRAHAPGLPREIAEVLGMMLEKAPEGRPASGMEAARLLEAILGESEDLETLLQKAFSSHTGIQWKRDDQRYRIELSFSNGRHQTAWVEPSQHAAAERVIRIWSVCCPAKPEYFETALRVNSELLHGGVAIREFHGKPYFVVIDNYPWATADSEEVRRSVLEVGHRADAIEKLLTGLDLPQPS